MNRNDFNRSVILYTLGLTLTSSLIRCSLNSKGVKKNSVLIIGAGAAGLYAGYLLKKLKIDFKILEASSNHGGRVGKIVGFADYDIDIGAQWLHGKQNIMGDYVQQHNIPITLDDTPYSYYFKNKIFHVSVFLVKT